MIIIQPRKDNLRQMRIASAFFVFIAIVTMLSGITPMAAAGITVTAIGTPTWQPVDLHVFSAPIGVAATGYAGFLATLAAILPPPKHVSDPVFGILPGVSHSPPYDEEIASGVSGLGFAEKTVFTQQEFSNGMGVYLAYMIAPGPGSAVGSSSDFAAGPIVPNSLLPIHSVYSTFRNGALFKALEMFDTAVPNGVAGYSHIPNFFANNFDFASDPSAGISGSYEYQIVLTDTAGNGWNIAAPFQVVPEPGTVALLGIGVVGLVVYRRRGCKRFL